jgi:hypothetical protein
VRTADKKYAGTDANVYLVLHGSKGESERVPLDKCLNNKDPFERGKVDLFSVESTVDVGKLEKLTVGHDGQGAGAGWYLDWIEVTCPTSGKVYRFGADRWLASDEGDGRTEVTLMVGHFACG